MILSVPCWELQVVHLDLLQAHIVFTWCHKLHKQVDGIGEYACKSIDIASQSKPMKAVVISASGWFLIRTNAILDKAVDVLYKK